MWNSFALVSRYAGISSSGSKSSVQVIACFFGVAFPDWRRLPEPFFRPLDLDEALDSSRSGVFSPEGRGLSEGESAVIHSE